MSAIALGTDFGGITDIETGPDGFLYILTLDRESDGEGKIYRITQYYENTLPTSKYKLIIFTTFDSSFRTAIGIR